MDQLRSAWRYISSEAFWQRAIPVLLVVLVFNVVVQFSWVRENLPFLHTGQLKFHRLLCSLAPRMVSAKWVRMVEINDDLHQQLGEPTNRAFLARLVQNAADGDATVIVLDFQLVSPVGLSPGQDAPSRRDQNEQLLRAINYAADKGVPVIVPCWLQADHGVWSRRSNIYLDSSLPLEDENGRCAHTACARLGYVNIPLDERQIPLEGSMKAPDPCSVSLALAAANSYDAVFDREPRTEAKPIVHHALEEKEFLFGSFIPEDQFQSISATKLSEDDSAEKEHCRGRIIVIGGKWHASMGQGELVDRHETPVGPMNGMYLQANYIESLLDDRYQLEVPILVATAFDLLVGTALYLSFHRANTNRGKAVVLGVFFIPLVASYMISANLGYYLDFILPLSACFVHLLVEFARSYQELRTEHAGSTK